MTTYTNTGHGSQTREAVKVVWLDTLGIQHTDWFATMDEAQDSWIQRKGLTVVSIAPGVQVLDY